MQCYDNQCNVPKIIVCAILSSLCRLPVLLHIFQFPRGAESFPWDLLRRGTRSIKHIIYYFVPRRVLFKFGGCFRLYWFPLQKYFRLYFQPIAACHQLIYQHDPVHFLEQSLPPALCQDDQTNGLLRRLPMPNLGECKSELANSENRNQ